jgi:protein-disulfide isomerase
MSRWVPRVALAVVGAAIVAAIVSISIGEEGPAAPAEGSEAVQRLYGGIEQEGSSLGSPDAPVTISVFNDVQCPECGEYQLEIVPKLVEDLVRPGDARLDLRHFSIGPRQITEGALATAAAAEQGAGWQFAHLMFLNLDQVGTSVDDKFLERVAAAVPGPEFDEDRWARDRDSAQVQAEVDADAELAAELRLPAMPAVIVDGPRGTRELVEEPPLDEIEAAVDEVR